MHSIAFSYASLSFFKDPMFPRNLDFETHQYPFRNRDQFFIPRCAPFMHIENCLNLIYIMLNQGSSCVNSLSYLVAPWPQYTFNYLLFSISVYMYVHCKICWPNKRFDLIWFDLTTKFLLVFILIYHFKFRILCKNNFQRNKE